MYLIYITLVSIQNNFILALIVHSFAMQKVKKKKIITITLYNALLRTAVTMVPTLK